jgi:hypothetical protein
MNTAHESTVELLTLHAVRLKGMADDRQVADRFGLDPAVAEECLLDHEAYGWITRVAFADLAGWTLTERGRTENARQLAAELKASGARSTVLDAYARFEPLNARLLRACTDWQLRPCRDDPLAANDHSDQAWDQRVLDELAALNEQLRPIGARLGEQLARLRGYDDRFATALRRGQHGEHEWVTKPRADSCHTVWMELHEDLLATLGMGRDG